MSYSSYSLSAAGCRSFRQLGAKNSSPSIKAVLDLRHGGCAVDKSDAPPGPEPEVCQLGSDSESDSDTDSGFVFAMNHVK